MSGSRFWRKASGAGCLFVLLMVWQGSQAAAFQEPAASTDWTIETIAGDLFSGPEPTLAGGQLMLKGSPAEAWPIDQIAFLRSSLAAGTSSAGGGTVRLVTGGSIHGSVTVSAETVRVQWQNADLELGLEDVAAVVWRDSPSLTEALQHPVPESDRIVVDSEQGPVVVAGLFEGISDGRLRIQYEGQSRTLPVERVSALLPARVRQPEPGEMNALATLVDGSTIGGRLTAISGGSMEMQIQKRLLRLPLMSVVSVALASDRVRRLSELEPEVVAAEVLFAPDRPWQRNRSVSGGPLRLADSTTGAVRSFDQGLGMRSGMRLAFEVDRSFDRLVGQVGIDAETGGRGDCIAQIRGDGAVLWSGRLIGGQPAQKLDIDVRDTSRIELEVLPGAQFDLADHVDWVDIRLLRTR